MRLVWDTWCVQAGNSGPALCVNIVRHLIYTRIYFIKYFLIVFLNLTQIFINYIVVLIIIFLRKIIDTFYFQIQIFSIEKRWFCNSVFFFNVLNSICIPYRACNLFALISPTPTNTEINHTHEYTSAINVLKVIHNSRFHVHKNPKSGNSSLNWNWLSEKNICHIFHINKSF